jgi:ABC-type nitrate/sulfonate/bicarbonate transport system substrate-binding protein
MVQGRGMWTAGYVLLMCFVVFSAHPVYAQAKKTIVFSSGVDPATAHGIIAQSLGLFQKHGVDVQVKKFPSAAAGVRTVVSGENDAGQATDMPVISPLVQGAKLKIIASTRKRLNKYAAVVAAENIKMPADLAGKKIGTVRGGSSGQMFMQMFLDYHKVRGAQPVWLQPQEQLIAFSKGDVDAVVVWVPWYPKALSVRPGAHVLAYDKDNNLYSSDSLIVIQERLEQDPNTVKGLLRALVEADEYIEKNRKGAEQILSKELNIKPEEIGALMDTVVQRLAIDDILVKHLCQSAKFLLSTKVIPNEPNWSAVIADKYLREVAPDRVTYKTPVNCG